MKLFELAECLEQAGYGLNVSTAKLICNVDDLSFYDRLYSISHEFGLICFVIADSEQDALDQAADDGQMEAFHLPDIDTFPADESVISHLGNNCAPHDLTYCYIQEL